MLNHLFKTSRLLLSSGPFLLALLCLPPGSMADEFDNLRIVAAQFPPYSYQDGEQLRGPAVEKVRALLRRLKIDRKIEIYP